VAVSVHTGRCLGRASAHTQVHLHGSALTGSHVGLRQLRSSVPVFPEGKVRQV
jgi:hypothetical protein